MDNRTGKAEYYLGIADAVLARSTCMRRKYGAIIVRSDEIISSLRTMMAPYLRRMQVERASTASAMPR